MKLATASENRSWMMRLGSRALAVVPFTPLLHAQAQPAGKVYRVGWLRLSPLPDHDALLEGLRDLGYVEQRNLSIERRDAEGHSERLPDLAVDLVRFKVDVIVAASTDCSPRGSESRVWPGRDRREAQNPDGGPQPCPLRGASGAREEPARRRRPRA
jgi:hypothetical protein